MAALVFVLNCIDMDDYAAAPTHAACAAQLVRSPEGCRVMDVLLQLYESTQLGESRAAHESGDVIVAIVHRLLVAGLVQELLAGLAPRSDSSRVSASHVALLRVCAECIHMRLDVLKSGNSDARRHACDTDRAALWMRSTLPLVDMLVELANYAEAAMRAVRQDGAADVGGLVRTHLALLALLESLTAAVMCGQELVAARIDSSGDTELLGALRSRRVAAACVSLLREAHTFMPAQSPFAVTDGTLPPPEGHAASSLHTAPRPPPDRPALPHLKRAVLQLLGALAFCPPPRRASHDVRAFQDLVRELGGLVDVLNLTMLDEHNPCTLVAT